MPFVKGDPNINRNGRPVGSKSFTTDFDEVVEEIANANHISINEARKVLLRKAYNEARNGNFPFYKDIADRYYGKAMDKLEHSGKVETIQSIKDPNQKELEELASKYEEELKQILIKDEPKI